MIYTEIDIYSFIIAKETYSVTESIVNSKVIV